jgi:chromosome segregation ATPase
LQLNDLDEAQARAASLQMELILLRQQLEAKECAMSDLRQREAELMSTVSSLNSENKEQQRLLQLQKDQQQLISTLQHDASKAAALQLTVNQLQEAARQGEESLLQMRSRVAAAESDVESVRSQLSAAEEKVASLIMAMKAQADAAAGSAAAAAAAAAASAVSSTRSEITQEIAFLQKEHASQLQQQQLFLQQQRNEYEEELHSLREQVRLLQDSIVVLNQERGIAIAALHSAQQMQQLVSSEQFPSTSNCSNDQAVATAQQESSAVAELREQLASKDREFRAVKGSSAAADSSF